MPSEYDFLLPYSRSFRRAWRGLLVAGAFVAGVGCTALIIALPLRSVGHDKVVSTADGKGEQRAAKGDKTASAPAKTASSATHQEPPRPTRDVKPEKPTDRTAQSTAGTATKP